MWFLDSLLSNLPRSRAHSRLEEPPGTNSLLAISNSLLAISSNLVIRSSPDLGNLPDMSRQQGLDRKGIPHRGSSSPVRSLDGLGKARADLFSRALASLREGLKLAREAIPHRDSSSLVTAVVLTVFLSSQLMVWGGITASHQ